MSDEMDRVIADAARVIDHWLPRFPRDSQLDKPSVMAAVKGVLEELARKARDLERAANDKILADMQSESPAYERGLREGRKEGYANGRSNEYQRVHTIVRLAMLNDLSEQGRYALQKLLRRVEDEKHDPQGFHLPDAS